MLLTLVKIVIGFIVLVFLYGTISTIKEDPKDKKGAIQLIIVFIVIVVIAVFILKGCSWLLSDDGDSDNDGLTDSFEQEIGTDPNSYTWNWEWND